LKLISLIEIIKKNTFIKMIVNNFKCKKNIFFSILLNKQKYLNLKKKNYFLFKANKFIININKLITISLIIMDTIVLCLQHKFKLKFMILFLTLTSILFHLTIIRKLLLLFLIKKIFFFLNKLFYLENKLLPQIKSIKTILFIE
jgi:hypothetical protein